MASMYQYGYILLKISKWRRRTKAIENIMSKGERHEKASEERSKAMILTNAVAEEMKRKSMSLCHINEEVIHKFRG